MIEFKNDRIKEEFNNPALNLRLRIILYAVSGYLQQAFNYNITLTELFRTQEEQDDIYKDDIDYLTNKFRSVHQEWRGADIRVFDMPEEVKTAVQLFLTHFEYSGTKKTALKHNVVGDHVHLQTDWDSVTEIKEREED